MTRREERERKAKIRADQYSHPVEWNDCYHHWIEGAEWADKTMLDKACEWLSKHAKKYYFNKEGHYLGTDELVEDFKLSMEL